MRLFYPTENKFLRFIGDVLITLGSWIVVKGEKWGGLYEYEFELEDDEGDDLNDV